MALNRSANFTGSVFRVALFLAAASLAAYIAYKYATHLHATSGLYAFMFPLSAVLAAVGMILAVNPQKACDCSTPLRAGIASISGLWLATGVMCVGMLTQAIMAHPLSGSMATFQMLAQHVFLSLSLLAFTAVPQRMAKALARPATVAVGGEAVA